jgi:hypothetical protein
LNEPSVAGVPHSGFLGYRLDRERMNLVAQLMLQRPVDHAMAFKAGSSGKRPRRDADAEMGFPSPVAGSGMPGMPVTFVRHLELRRRQRILEQLRDSPADRTERAGFTVSG